MECVFGLENMGPPLSFVGGKKTLERGKIIQSLSWAELFYLIC